LTASPAWSRRTLDLVHSLHLDAGQPIVASGFQARSDEQRRSHPPFTIAPRKRWSARLEPNGKPGSSEQLRFRQDVLPTPSKPFIKHQATLQSTSWMRILQCFDRICTRPCWTSCTRSATPSSHRRLAEAGVMEGKNFPHKEGPVKGRNLAVTGERRLARHGEASAMLSRKESRNGRRVDWKPNLIAMPMTCHLHADRQVIQQCHTDPRMVRPLGLELKPARPPVSHLHAQQDQSASTSWASPFVNSRWASTIRGRTAGNSWLQDQHQNQQRKVQLHCTAGRPHPPWRELTQEDLIRRSTHHSRVEQLLPDRGQCANLRALRPQLYQVYVAGATGGIQKGRLGGAEILAPPG